jgi:hypothetical protein
MNVVELQRILRDVDDKAVLVSTRILERVLREAYELPGLIWALPHTRSFVCDRQTLFRHAEQADLELPPDQLLPDTVILLARPETDELSSLERQKVLLKYWRRLFHSRVHLAFLNPDKTNRLTDEGLVQRVAVLGQTTFEEIRRVLIEDRYLPASADTRTAYIEFAAVYLELFWFDKKLLESYFPGIGEKDQEKVHTLLARDVDSHRLFDATRLPHAANPDSVPEVRTDESQEAYWNLVRAAQRAILQNNRVKAAILLMRASRIAPGAFTLSTRNDAEAEITQLVQRLARVIDLEDPSQRQIWSKMLIKLLDKADQGVLPVEERLLSDLQRACEAHEREVYTIDLIDYLCSMGKRPIRRPLPSQRKVRVVRHLDDARGRLEGVRLSEEDRKQLNALLDTAYNELTRDLHARFRPILTTALEDVGLRPDNPVERVAFDKMIREILDRITKQGVLTFGELRDTLSRNHLKLPDLREPDQFFRGDALLQLDNRLSSLLDGVYRRGETYTRWLAHSSSLLFGTVGGRILTRGVLLPVILAWMTIYLLGFVLSLVPPKWSDSVQTLSLVMMGPVHTWAEQAKKIQETDGPEKIDYSPPPQWFWHVALVMATALFALALQELEGFRRRFLQGLYRLGVGLRRVFWDWPIALIPIETIRLALASWPFQLFYWVLLKPGVVVALCVWIWPEWFTRWYAIAGAFVAASLVVNSAVGKSISEAFRDVFVQLVILIRSGLIPGIIRWTMEIFKTVVHTLELIFFRIDEALRFSTSDNRFTLIARTILGALWTPIAAVIHFFMVVLIEPLVNPLKLPITFLFAKVYYALGPAFGLLPSIQHPPLADWIGMVPAYLLALGIINLFPSVGGFLGWEMRENWGLYRANRERHLQALALGPHGETMHGLLVPGFHSGTIPTLYARLRSAERQATRTRNWSQARMYRHQLHHVEESLQHFAERELIALLKESRDWGGIPVKAGRVMPATNRVIFSLQHPEYATRDIRIEIQHHHERLIARVRDQGWGEILTPPQRRALQTALAGFYKRCGVDLVREQILAHVSAPVLALEFGRSQIVTRTALDAEPVVLPLEATDPAQREQMRSYLFQWQSIPWERWVQCWKSDAEGKGNPGIPGVSGNLFPDIPLSETRSGAALPTAANLPGPEVAALAPPPQPVVDEHQGQHRLAHDHEAG